MVEKHPQGLDVEGLLEQFKEQHKFLSKSINCAYISYMQGYCDSTILYARAITNKGILFHRAHFVPRRNIAVSA
jgi:hypothetical protein